MSDVEQKFEDGSLNELFKNHKVSRAYLFGSWATGNPSKDSDVDLLITFEDGLSPLQAGELWWSLYDRLREILGRKVDLVTERSLRNPFFIKELDRTRKLIYG